MIPPAILTQLEGIAGALGVDVIQLVVNKLEGLAALGVKADEARARIARIDSDLVQIDDDIAAAAAGEPVTP